MPHKIAITSGDGQTGHLIAELLLTSPEFKTKLGGKGLTVLTHDPEKTADLEKLGAIIVPVAAADTTANSTKKATTDKGGKAAASNKSSALVAAMKEAEIDTICLIPPARGNKVQLTHEMVEVAKKAGVQNVLLISAAACEYADAKEQPVLNSFLEIEAMVLAMKGVEDVPLGHSPCVIRPALYAETLLLVAKQAQSEGALRLPIGPNHKMAPIALGDVALLAAHILTGEGKHGFDDRHRGQLITATGPMMLAGEEIVTAIEESIGVKLEFEDIDPAQAKKHLTRESDLDPSEIELLLEYYALTRQGKLNYISTLAGFAVTGQPAQELTDFFKTYDGEFTRKRRRVGKNEE